MIGFNTDKPALDRWEFGIKVSGTCLSNLRFADDISLLANSEGELQQLVDRVHVISSRFGLVISDSKTEAQCIGRDSQIVNIKLGASSLKQTEHFVYLGGTVSADQSCDKDVERRIGLAAEDREDMDRQGATRFVRIFEMILHLIS